MKKQLLAVIALSVVSAGLMSQAIAQQSDPKAATGASAAAAATEDVIYMRDGRVLHGQILAETSRGVTFEYTDRAIKVTTKLILKPEDIAEIMRDQPLADAPAASDADDGETSSEATAMSPTVATALEERPLEVALIVTEPAATADSTPVLETDAMALLLELQVTGATISTPCWSRTRAES